MPEVSGMDGGSSGRRPATHSKHSRFGSGHEEGARRMDARRNGSAGCREHIDQAQEVEAEDEEFRMIPKSFVSAVCLGLFALIAFASSATPDRSWIAARRGTTPALEAAQPSDSIVIRSGVRPAVL